MKKLILISIFLTFIFGDLRSLAQERTSRAQITKPRYFMPNLVGEDVDAAEQKLKGVFPRLSIKKKSVEESEFNPRQVVRHEPPAKMELNAETKVILYYKKTPSNSEPGLGKVLGDLASELTREVVVPDVRGQFVRDAKRILKVHSLNARFRSKEDDFNDLTVIDQSPTPGAKVIARRAVTLTVEQPQKPAPPTSYQPPRQRFTKVPELIGQSEADARQKIEQARLAIGEITTEEAPQNWGRVLRQSPLPGTQVVWGTSVNLVIAVKPQPVIVPPLLGLSLVNAERVLNRSELKRGFVVGVNPATSGAVVVDQKPAPGSRVDKGSSVNLTIGFPATPTPLMVNVPDLKGQTTASANQQLRGGNLRLGQITTLESNETQGTVIQQQPASGTLVAIGTVVNIVLAAPLTPAVTPTPTVTPTPVVVPDLRGKSRIEAIQSLRAASLGLGQVTTQPSNFPLGTVIEQQPLPGSSVQAGFAVNVVLAATPVPPATPLPSSPPSPPPSPPKDWLSDLIAQIPKVLGVAGIGFAGFLLVSLLKRLFKKTGPKEPLPSLTSHSTPTAAKPKIEYRARDDQGTQKIEAESKLSLPFELTLRPRPDAGRQWIEVVGQLIANERRQA
ncbi:MAG: PASTA domain-containing protein [Acidobacteria bacterium]|nr:PASTA domain-containing protein [Acidobacteriota bacterium]